MRRSMRVFIVIAVLLTLTVAVSASAAAAPLRLDDDPEGKADEPDSRDGMVELSLGNGNELKFIPMYNEKGEIEGYGVVENIVPGGVEVSRMRELRDLDPVELISALTGAETKIPQVMLDLYGKPTRSDRGWGLSLVPGPAQGGGADDASSCMDPSAFDDDFPGYQEKFVTLNDGPDTVPSHWLPSQTPGDFHTWGAVYNVRQYYTKVTRCNVDEDQFIWGPDVVVGYRNNQNYPPWGVGSVASASLDEYGASMSFTWHPPAPSSLYDFRVSVYNVLNDDTFHIGIEWSKAFGFTIG